MKKTIVKRNHRTARVGFSLVELLAVIGIIGILLGIAFPATQAVRQAARKAHCSSNLRQVMMSALAYEATHGGFPTADNKGGSFLIPLLPHLEQDQLFHLAKAELASGETFQDRWGKLCENSVEILLCPASSPQATKSNLNSGGMFATHYVGMSGPVGSAIDTEGIEHKYSALIPTPSAGPVGLQGLFSPDKRGRFRARRMSDIRDGTSNTIALGESSQTVGDATSAVRNGWAFGVGRSNGKSIRLFSTKSVEFAVNSSPDQLNNMPLGSNHPSGTQVSMVDGSVHFVHNNINVSILKTFASIDGTERLESLEEF